MLKLTKNDFVYILGVLVEHQAKLAGMAPYPEQENDLKPYGILIRKIAKYRDELATTRANRSREARNRTR